MLGRCLIALALAGALGAAEISPLASSTSEFVRAQAASAVRWQPWNEATLARARTAGRPIYVFVGTPLSELTRATIQQTFSSEKTVAWLNENFCCVLVDADTQPDVAAYAQHFLASVKQLRGWPAHLWLTPELQPYDGANYLPPSEEWGKPGYLKAARAALEAWTIDPARARALAGEAMTMMKPVPLSAASKVDRNAKLKSATAAWVAAADAQHGGFGEAPKQPEPELIRFLLAGDNAAREVALKAARALVAGAVRDPVDGGFYRRAVDEAWKEPYRQKILSDQARIAFALLEAADRGKDDTLRAAALGALDFALKELRLPDGSFAAALDGTLEENADPAKRPNFVRVGRATIAAQGLLAAALQRTGEKRFTTVATQLASKLSDQLRTSTTATATDYLAVALACRYVGDVNKQEDMVLVANQLFLDPAGGVYFATSGKLPLGIPLRVPVLAHTPSAEVLALLAGTEIRLEEKGDRTGRLLQRALLAAIEYDEQPPGDVLLALGMGR
ncbi:MAG TPA: DUF255 domain-containing protein [Opitutaceae bacterium]|nr:DUF255 domain-containing protein [Opitutaceae bacterium]